MLSAQQYILIFDAGILIVLLVITLTAALRR